MSAELIVNKAVVNQFIAEMYESNGENVSALVTEDFHLDAWGGRAGAQGDAAIRQMLALVRGTLREPRVAILEMFAQGDKVVARYTVEGEYRGETDGVDIPSRQVRLPGIMIARVRDQKVAECWQEEDRLAMYQQLAGV